MTHSPGAPVPILDYAPPGPPNPLRRDLLLAGAALVWAIWWSFRFYWPFSLILEFLPPKFYHSDLLVRIPVWLVLWLALWFICSRTFRILLPVLTLTITSLGSAAMGFSISLAWGSLDMAFVERMVGLELPGNLVGFVTCEASVLLRPTMWRAAKP